MEKKFKLGVIGSGFMATAIIKGAISSKILNPNQIAVYDISAEALDKISKLQVKTYNDVKNLANDSEFILLSVKPQNFNDVADSLKGVNVEKVISIMAGVKKQNIRQKLGGANVARCMPNTPCSISCGAIGLDVSSFDKNVDKTFVFDLLSALGGVTIVEESMLNIVTGVSGSSPAYFYMFVKGIIDAGVKRGLSYEEAKNLAVNTMIGSGKMILSNPDKNIDELITAVCSKGGTTIQAVDVFNKENLNDIIDEAVDACVKRSIELEGM